MIGLLKTRNLVGLAVVHIDGAVTEALQYALGPRLGGQLIAALQWAPQLRELHLGYAMLSESGVEALHHLRNLEQLTLFNALPENVNDTVRALARATSQLPKLWALTLGEQYGINENAMEAFVSELESRGGRLEELRRLRMVSVSLGDGGFRVVMSRLPGRAPKLTAFELEHVDLEGSFDLAALPLNLEKLSLDENFEFNDGGLTSLSTALMARPHYTSLRELSLNEVGHDFSPAAMRKLGAALAHAPNLQTVRFENNGIRFGSDGAEALFESMPEMGQLARLFLSWTYLRDGGVIALARQLPRFPRLNKLVLAGVKMGGVGAEALLSAAAEAKQLRHLNLDGNFLISRSSGSMAYLHTLVPRLTHLETLDISGTGIPQDTCDAMLQAEWECGVQFITWGNFYEQRMAKD